VFFDISERIRDSESGIQNIALPIQVVAVQDIYALAMAGRGSAKKGRNCKTNPIFDATYSPSMRSAENIFKNVLSKTYWRFFRMAFWRGRVGLGRRLGLFRPIPT